MYIIGMFHTLTDVAVLKILKAVLYNYYFQEKSVLADDIRLTALTAEDVEDSYKKYAGGDHPDQ